MKPFIPLLGLLVVCPSFSSHAAVNPAIIPADARWVVYADLNALRASAVGKELVAAAEHAQSEHGKNAIGIDLQKVMTTIGSATAYGSNFSRDPAALDGTLVLQGTPDLRKIAESILLQATIATPAGFSEINDLPFPAYSIHPQKTGKAPEEGKAPELVVAFPPEPIVLVSKSKAQLLKAREVFRGQAPSLARGGEAPLNALIAGSRDAYLFATSVVPSDTLFPEDQPQARILKMTRSGSVAIGEAGEKTFAHAQLIATSGAMADKIMKILDGMTALVSLAETNDKQLADFLNSASVSRENDTVTLHFAYASDRLVQMIHAFAEKPKPRHEPTPEEATAARNAELFNGDAVAQWQAERATEGAESTPAPGALAWHTIEKVELKNGTIISLGRQQRGGKPVRFDRVEITPADGGAPLTFQTQFMSRGGPRNSFVLFQFPGADGSYRLKVAYVNDPEGKAMYSVSVRQPKVQTTAAPEAKKD